MKRVAVCLHGKIGGLSGKNGLGNGEEIILYISYSLFKKNILVQNKNVEIDVFVHCWDSKFEAEIKELFIPKACIVEEPKHFSFSSIPENVYKNDPKRLSNHCSRWCSYKEVVNLKNNYEIINNIRYDAVLSSRIDMAWKEPILFHQMNHKFIWHSNIITYENKYRYFYPQAFLKLDNSKKDNLKKCVQSYPECKQLWDAWFYASNDITNDIATIFDSFEFFATYRGPNSKISHHKILFDLLEFKKYLHLLKSYKDYTPYFPVRLSFEKFSVYHLQKQDLSIFDKSGCSKRKFQKKITSLLNKFKLIR